MNDAPLPPPVHAPALQPLPYLQDVVQYLREHEPDVWRWAMSATAQAEHAEAVRNDLMQASGMPANLVTATGGGSSQLETPANECKGMKASQALITCLRVDRRVEVQVLGSQVQR